MSVQIAILDYGMGNLKSAEKGFQKMGADACVCHSMGEISTFDGVVLPGVGAFGDAVKNLKKLGFFDFILELFNRNIPILGICLGMQLFFEVSEEHGRHSGLGIIPGTVRKLQGDLKVPHVGWNTVEKLKDDPILDGVKAGTRFYFVHSFFCEPKRLEDTVGVTPYGTRFASVVHSGSAYGLQFHPEKSSMAGLRVLSNFVRIASRSRKR